MDRPGGYEPSNARSTRAGDAVAVAERAMHRIVAPDYAGSVSAPLRVSPSGSVGAKRCPLGTSTGAKPRSTGPRAPRQSPPTELLYKK